MGKGHGSTAYFSFGGTDFTAYARNITVRDSRGELDVSDLSAAGIKRIAGAPDWEITVDLYNDFADDAVNEDLAGLLGVEGALIFRPSSAVIGTSNPQYTGNGMFFENPITLNKGEVNMVPLVIKCSDGVALARATA